MRALVTLACLVLSVMASRPALAQATIAPGNVTLQEACETVGRAGCVMRVSIVGPIMIETAHTFAAMLDFEQKRAGASVKPIVSIQSTGGDVIAAMSIGREIRKRAGETFSNGPCHSACVFVAMGGVERNIAGIGLHRPYFARSETDVLAEADARYKRLIRLVADYVFEMNISDEVLRMITSIPPDEMRLLGQLDARRIGLNGVDPAYDEMRIGQAAAQYGLSSAEWRQRLTLLDRQCGREADMRSREALRGREECQNRLRERVLWGFDEATFERLNHSTANRCRAMAPDSPERRACVRQIADAIRHEAQLR